MRRYLEAVTLILPGCDALPGELNDITILAVKRTCRKAFKKHAPAAAGLMCIDVSLNVKSAVSGEDHWQVHIHGIVSGVKMREWTSMRKDPKSVIPVRGLFVKEAVNPIGQLAYMSKSNFFRRVDYVDDKGWADTRHEALSVTQELELAQWLSPYRAHGRFFAIGEDM